MTSSTSKSSGSPVVEPRGDQVLDDLGLAVDDDRPAVGELAERDPVPLAVELELDPVVDDALALQPLADAGLGEQVDRALLEHAGPDPVLDVVAAAVLEHDRLDPRPLEQPRERQPGRARRRRSRPACASASSASLEPATCCDDRERAVGRGHAAVDRAWSSTSLISSRREAVAARGADVHARARPQRPSATSAVSVMQLRVLPVEARAASRSRPRRSA